MSLPVFLFHWGRFEGTCVSEIHCLLVRKCRTIFCHRDPGQRILSDFSLTKVLFSERMGSTLLSKKFYSSFLDLQEAQSQICGSALITSYNFVVCTPTLKLFPWCWSSFQGLSPSSDLWVPIFSGLSYLFLEVALNPLWKEVWYKWYPFLPISICLRAHFV